MASAPTTRKARELLLAEASKMRGQISEMLAEIADEKFSLDDLLNRRQDQVLAQIYVVKVLEKFSKIGKVRAREGLDALHIAHKLRFGDLNAEQAKVLLREFKQ
ncbi:MAG: hypothetical protein ACKPAF_02590 [Actinomycetota bacterium]